MTGSDWKRSTDVSSRPTPAGHRPPLDAQAFALVERCRSALLSDTTPVTERLRLRHALRALIEEVDLGMLEPGGANGFDRSGVGQPRRRRRRGA